MAKDHEDATAAYSYASHHPRADGVRLRTPAIVRVSYVLNNTSDYTSQHVLVLWCIVAASCGSACPD
jgi:hypothetical protein